MVVDTKRKNMMGTAMASPTDDTDFETQLEHALKTPSDEAARAMLARGRFIAYVENDTPSGHVIREYPDGTKETVRIDLSAAA